MRKVGIAKTLLHAALVTSLVALALISSAPMLYAQSQVSPADHKFIFLLPDGFRGWVCIDFGIEGAPPMPRQGDALVVRPSRGQVLQTSDRVAPWTLGGEAWFEVNGKRKSLPKDVTLKAGVSRTGPTEPTERG